MDRDLFNSEPEMDENKKPEPQRARSRQKRRLLIIDLGSHYGGVEIYLNGLSEILSDHVQIFSLCSLPKLAAQFRAKGVHVICTPILRNKWCKAIRLMIAVFVVPWMLLSYRIDIVQLNGYFESMLLPMIRLLGRPAIYTMHGPFETEQYRWYVNPERFFPRLLSRYCLNFATQIVCVSESVGNIARRAFKSTRLCVIPNWVTPASFKKSRSYTLSKPVRLLCAGRLEKYKGIQLVVGLMIKLPGANLIVAGDGSYRRDLERLADGLPVEFVGFISDLTRYYECCDIFINPTLGPEGLPLVSLEAMANGVPCVFSDIAVHKEITRNGTSACLFESGNEESLFEALTGLLARQEQRELMAELSLEAVENRYSDKSARIQYLKVFGIHAN